MARWFGPRLIWNNMKQLQLSIGKCSQKGTKPVNQDFHGESIPQDFLLSTKGAAVVLADGISSSNVSQEASQAAVNGFIADYYATPESWSVKTSVQRVMQAINSWLYAQTRNGPYRYDINKGYVCTFSALVFKSTTAHLFHIGDARIFRLSQEGLEQLTEDHRLWVSREKSYLRRALGMGERLEIDYRSIPVEENDIFILATDGVYEFASEKFIVETLQQHQNNYDKAAELIVEEALKQASDDNLTIQIVRVEQLPEHRIDELQQQISNLPFPPELAPRMEFDGYRIVRELYHSPRSHVYLAIDQETQEQVVIKTPSKELSEDKAYLERFLMEDWVARRIDNIHVIKHCNHKRKRNYLYLVTEYIEGQSLAQWMIDNPKPSLGEVRDIVEQIGKAVQALHRQEIIHQDLRPNNVLIDSNGTVKLIDFGSVSVAGVAEVDSFINQPHLLGTMQYTAPEYFLGEYGTARSDLFSLGVIVYQMLSGQLPYGVHISNATNKMSQRRLIYQTVLDDKRTIPLWIDETIRKAVHIEPSKRYWEVSEFIHDLRQPNQKFLRKKQAPLIDRNPLLFWKGLSLLLLMIVLFLVFTHPDLATSTLAKP